MTQEEIKTELELGPKSSAGAADTRLKAAFEAGLQWGRIKRLTHPKMQQFILTSKGDVQVIDLAKTLDALDKAKDFVMDVARKGGTLLIVGTQPAARAAITEYAQRLGLPYVAERWLGGTITNFQTLLSRIAYLKSLEEKINSAEFASYTKRERSKMQREYAALKEKFEGLRFMSRLPDAILILGIKRHETVLREAKRKGIPVIALVNTNDDPTGIAWPIPGNDSAVPAIRFILEEFTKAIEEGRKASEKKEENTQ